MERELRDLYDINSQLTGRTYYKGDPVPEGCHPMVVGILIENSKGEFLLQRRSENKGGYWAITGGHPKAGETPEQGMATEVMEEIGIDISGDELLLFDSGCDGHDCFRFYYLKKDVDISKCVLQEDEVADVAWFDKSVIKQQIEDGTFDSNQGAFFKRYYRYLEKQIKA